jgi:hypothetical protein
MKNQSMILPLVLAGLASMASATLGVDYADNYSLSDLQCLKSHGVNFAIVRAWHSYGAFDSNAIPQLKYAKTAGIPNVDVYLFPCKGKSAQE